MIDLEMDKLSLEDLKWLRDLKQKRYHAVSDQLQEIGGGLELLDKEIRVRESATHIGELINLVNDARDERDKAEIKLEILEKECERRYKDREDWIRTRLG